jgi:hypothetical protein
MNNKTIFILVGIIVLCAGIIFVASNSGEPEYSAQCYQKDFIDVYLHNFDRQELEEQVIDFYVDDKEISTFYWDKICYDLLKIRLNETLYKSGNLWLYNSNSYFYDDDIELSCNYKIFWGEDGPFYNRAIESNQEFFSSEEVILAQEKRPLIYNESLITTEWREVIPGLNNTIIKNENSDFNVVVRLMLNGTTEVCE